MDIHLPESYTQIVNVNDNGIVINVSSLHSSLPIFILEVLRKYIKTYSHAVAFALDTFTPKADLKFSGRSKMFVLRSWFFRGKLRPR
jgi:hypothetical protein